MAQYLSFDDSKIINLTNSIENAFNYIGKNMDAQCGLGEGNGYLGELWHFIPDTDIRTTLAKLAANERSVYDYLRKDITKTIEFLRSQTSAYIEAEAEAAHRIEMAMKSVDEVSRSILLPNGYLA